MLVVFLTGGSARADMSALIILRPISVLVLGYGLLTLSREHLRAYRPLAIVAIAAVALAVLHLLPLPPALWQALPGRETIAEIDDLLGLEGLWRPLTMDPQATRNALMALITPCAVLAVAMQLDRKGRETMLTFVLGLGALTAIWALMQLMGSSRGPLYLYDVTNYGAPVGLFANRNHQAVFLASLIPLGYCWTQLAHGSWKDLRSSKGRRGGMAIAGALLVVPLILIAGSRAGLLALVLAICATIAMVALAPRRGRGRSRRPALARFAPAAASIAVVAGLVVVTVGLGRDRAFERLIGSDPIANARVDLFPMTWDIVARNFPWGTGLGSFDDVYRMYEPDALLMPSYVNHAHNDFLEIAMTGGLVGVAILVCALGAFFVRAWTIARAGRSEILKSVLPIAALIAFTVLLVASLVDYPLRTPAMASYAVLLAIWAWKPSDARP